MKAENLQLSAWADQFLDDIDYERELKKGEKNPENAENRMRNLRELTRTMDNKGETLIPSNRLVKFLDDITLDAEREEDREEKGDMVTLITTHSCKGLEYPHVFSWAWRKVCCAFAVGGGGHAG